MRLATEQAALRQHPVGVLLTVFNVEGVLKPIFSLMSASAVLAAMALSAQAAPLTFSGQDDGVGTDGPFTNSNATASAFLTSASLYGPVGTATFENLPVGENSPITIFPGVTAAYSDDTTPGYRGVSNSNDGNLYGFNVTPGGSNWYGFSGGSATFTFANPTHSFGTYITGVQSTFGTEFTFNFSDGTSQSLAAPVNTSGGVAYFGITDQVAISSLTISRPGVDAWGIDDVSFNVSEVPLPASFPMFATALLGLATIKFRVKSKRRRVLPSTECAVN